MALPTSLHAHGVMCWEIPTSHGAAMRVPARIFAAESMLKSIGSDRSIEQLVNVTSLPGIQEAALVMPDVHEGYGFPIGGIAATEYPHGVISPGGIGYDINCGVRMLTTEFRFKQLRNKFQSLAEEMFKRVPSGVGRDGLLKLSANEMDKVLNQGAPWMVAQGFGTQRDIHFTESGGCLEWAEASKVSDDARRRGQNQLGTMGSGNHFVELDRVDAIFDLHTAQTFGLEEDQIVVLIHTGSRGLGHQVATDYIRTMIGAMPRYDIVLPDRELACVPFSSNEGRDYFGAMAAAANFAWANRQLITCRVREAFDHVLGAERVGSIEVLYDVAHNIAKIEDHTISGQNKRVIVHRKGATRAFGPGHPDVVSEYRSVGQPVLIPGSMGTASWVLAGTEMSMQCSFGSTCHGAGRRMSRSKARRMVHAADLIKELKHQGIVVQAGSKKGVAEEAPQAYKDVDSVVEVVHDAGIARKVARVRPLAVIKG